MKPTLLILIVLTSVASAQEPPYDVYPDAPPPYYRVRYEASTESGELSFPENYTVWIPLSVKTLRGLIVHQHGCGEGSCKSGLTGAFDLHWQALARKHDCALTAPSYEQPQDADCQLWCDPRNGSAEVFKRSLTDLGHASGHPELADVPWALWGHSGGGVWVGAMTMLYPDRVAAAWLRSGAPLLESLRERPTAKTIEVPDAALEVPMMLNLGTKEGVTVKEGRFASVWPRMEQLLTEMRGRGGLVGVAVDPLTGHECGNQRYLAIPWFDACLAARLPAKPGQPLRPMPAGKGWLAPVLEAKATAESQFTGNKSKALWLPNESIANAWIHYVTDTNIPDTTPPPAPTNVRVKGSEITWNAEADLESGVAYFVIERNRKEIGRVPEKSRNPYGRPIFQGLQYSDTPIQPLVQMRFTDTSQPPGEKHDYRVIAENTAGLRSRQ